MTGSRALEMPRQRTSRRDSSPEPTQKVQSLILRLLVYGAAIFTFAVLAFLIGYILIKGIPYLTPDLFSWTYNSTNCSMLPSIITTVEMTLLSLLIAIPISVFTAVYLVEYAKKGNKLVGLMRLTAETLSGIPSIVYGLFGMLFFVTQLHWKLSLLSGAMTLSIMVLPLIMRSTEEALLAVPDMYREASFGLGAGRLRTVFRIGAAVRDAGHSGRHHSGSRPHRRRDSRTDLHRRHRDGYGNRPVFLRAARWRFTCTACPVRVCTRIRHMQRLLCCC